MFKVHDLTLHLTHVSYFAVCYASLISFKLFVFYVFVGIFVCTSCQRCCLHVNHYIDYEKVMHLRNNDSCPEPIDSSLLRVVVA